MQYRNFVDTVVNTVLHYRMAFLDVVK